MKSSQHEPVRYIGGPQFHDAYIREVRILEKDVEVTVQAEDSHVFNVVFCDVSNIKANHPEGMMLYALAERAPSGVRRRFPFVNWDERDDACLDLEAMDYRLV